MKLAFYPGCSLEGMATDYATSITSVFSHLETELVEIEDWSCCGATAAHSMDEAMAVLLPARNLAEAEKMDLDIVSPCANCFNRLSYSKNMIRKKIHDIPWKVIGELQVHDMTRFLAGDQMIDTIKQRVVMPLKSLRVVCYYGCQMVRPPRITGFTDYENPMTLDRIAEAVGAEVADWSYKATCCGASIGIGRRDIQMMLSKRLVEKAIQAGAEAIVVSCPLCQANLDMVQKDMSSPGVPIYYFTELLRLAFEGREFIPGRLRMHFTEARTILRQKGLLD